MCGICSIWGSNDKRELLEQMKSSLVHRGPDSEGTFQTKNGLLGHQRLGIVDIDNGMQPIYNEDRTLAIVANGEIYNHEKLRHDLSYNQTFQTKSDSETILHLYEEKGLETPRFLDGMYAFCIADENDIFIARDALGIKPLYYLKSDDDVLYVSSEIKSLKQIDGKVLEFPPGSWYHSRYGFKNYDKINHDSYHAQPVNEISSALKTLLEASVQKRLIGEVSMGILLSGDLDSSIITSIATKYSKNILHTFSVGFEDSEDLENARYIADKLGTKHHEYLLTEKEIADELPQIIFHLESFDQDLVRCAISNYFACKMASKFVKIVLSGEGADELFAGYDYHLNLNREQELTREVIRSISNLHNINLQRVDRMTMAHSIEGRVPFLDMDMVKFSVKIPPCLLISGNPATQKWILRKAFEHELPREIVWRKKKQFAEGSGITKRINSIVSNYEDSSCDRTHKDIFLRSREERLYYKLFSENFSDRKDVIDLVGRWKN